MQKAARLWLEHIKQISQNYEFAPEGEYICKRNEAGTLHSEIGPAIRTHHMISYWVNGRRHGPTITRNGTIVYFFKDVTVPSHYITEPETITFEEVITHANTEVRRVGCEIYGFDRMIAEKKFELVHQDDKTGASLYLVHLNQKKSGGSRNRQRNNDELMQVVRVLDGTPVNGIRKVYFLQVPPTCKTCAEAIAWTFRKTADEYAPTIET